MLPATATCLRLPAPLPPGLIPSSYISICELIGVKEIVESVLVTASISHARSVIVEIVVVTDDAPAAAVLVA